MSIERTVTEFDIPFAIPVPDGSYNVRLRGVTSEVTVRKISRKEHAGLVVEGTGEGTVEIARDKHGRFAYSHIIVIVPRRLDLNESGRKPPFIDGTPRMKIKMVALEFLNRLIDVVRYVTEEFYLEHVTYSDVSSYDVRCYVGDRQVAGGPVLIDTGTGGLRITVGKESFPEDRKSQITKILSSEAEIELSKILVLNAKDAVLSEDNRRAILEVVTAMEIELYRFIRVRGRQLQIPQDTLDNFLVEVGLTGNVDVVLRMLTVGLDMPDKELLGFIKGAIKIRNEIIHEGLLQIPESETEMRITKIEGFITYLRRLRQQVEGEISDRWKANIQRVD